MAGAASAPALGPRLTILVVCTGNVCRSPLAERFGRAHLARVAGRSGHVVDVVSAGTRAVVGSGMHPASAAALTGLGGDPSGFRARQLTDRMASTADLTLTMTREHRQQVLARAPRAMSRTFTLREAAGLLDLLGPGSSTPGDTPEERVRALVRAMAGVRSRRPGSAADDVLDPIGRPDEVHVEVGRLVADALETVLDAVAVTLSGRVAAPTAAGGPGA